MSGSKEKHHVGEGAWVPLGTHPSASSHHGIRAQTLGQEVPKTGKCLTCVSVSCECTDTALPDTYGWVQAYQNHTHNAFPRQSVERAA